MTLPLWAHSRRPEPLSRADAASATANANPPPRARMMSPFPTLSPFPPLGYCFEQSPLIFSEGLSVGDRKTFTQITSFLALTLFPSSVTHKPVNFILKSPMNTHLCTHFPTDSFALSIYYLSKILDHFSISLIRNKVPILSKKHE